MGKYATKTTRPIEAARHILMASCHEAYVVVVVLFFGTGTETPSLILTKFKNMAFWPKFNAREFSHCMVYVLTGQVICDNSYV